MSTSKSTRYRDSELVQCELCGLFFKPRGLSKHQTSCKRKQEEQTELKNIERNERKRLKKLQKPDHGTPLLTNQDIREHDLSWNMDQGTHDPLPLDADQQANDNSTDQAPPAAFSVDDIRIQFHPSSGRPPRIEHFDQFQRYQQNAPPPVQAEPWKPWRSREDFEFAELVLKAALTKEQTSMLVKLFRRCLQGEGNFTINSYTDMMDTWSGASDLMTRFEKHTICVPYKKKVRKYEFWSRPIWEWLLDLVHDPQLAPFFEWDAQILSKFDGQSFVRFIDEPWTASRFWDVQSKLPPNGKPLGIILYADKSKLSSFGTQMAYPIVARCANLQVEVRNGTDVGGGRIVGWLPIVPEEQQEKGKSRFVDFKRVVWHESFKKLLETLRSSVPDGGFWTSCGDKIDRLLCPFIVILSADYEEQCVMVLNRGFRGLSPCPVCLVPPDQLANMSQPFPKRSGAETERLVKHAQTLKVADREALLKPQGLRCINNAFWEIPHSDPHAAASWDHMHSYGHGLGGKHMLPVLQDHVHDLGRHAAAKVDAQMSSLPRWRNLNHFNAVMDIQFSDATKLRDILKMLPFVMHNILTKQASREGYLMLRCLRSYLRLDMYAGLEVHTEVTIAAGRRELQRFYDDLQSYIAATPYSGKDWNFPKAHTHQHLFDDIEAKGVTRNYDTKPNESLHGPIRDSYLLRTNFKDIADQILKVDHMCYVASVMRQQLDALDNHNERHSLSEQEQDDIRVIDNATSLEGFGKFKFGAGQPPRAIRDIEEKYAIDSAFTGFRQKLRSSLSRLLPTSSTRPFIDPADQVTEYRLLRSFYESKVSWKMEVDYLRCSPQFHNQPRYDCVIVETFNGFIFARLIFMFTFTVGDVAYPLALIQPLDAPIGRQLQMERHLGLIRLRAKRRAESEIISVRSIVRGAYVVEKYDCLDMDFYAVDYVDGDMFLRLNDMYPGRDA